MTTLMEKTHDQEKINATCCGGLNPLATMCCSPTDNVMAEAKMIPTDDGLQEVIKNDQIREAVRKQYSKIAESSTSGCGGGFDNFLAARQVVGDCGFVIGVDMTPEMVTKARANAVNGGYRNVSFRLGEIENLPVADGTVDVILSNCVINLSPDKFRFFTETYRVLKPDGRLAISDVAAVAELPKPLQNDMALYTGCIAGAALVSEIEKMLRKAGFGNIRITPRDESKPLISDWVARPEISDYVVSATIVAVKN